MADIRCLHRIIEPEVQHLGYELVRVCMIGGSTDPTLQVMAERLDTRQLDLADCERISRRLSDMFDLCDPIEGGYRLEVSFARHRPAAHAAQRLLRLGGL